MEAIRPDVDDFLLQWVTRETLKRDWFLELNDGNARLMAELAVKLSETAPTWRRAVAPIAEWVAQELWNSTRSRVRNDHTLPTRLTQRRRSEGRGNELIRDVKAANYPKKVCPGCGTTTRGSGLCVRCGREVRREKLIEIAKLGRVVAQSPKSQRERSKSQRRHRAAQLAWRLSDLPDWLTEATYVGKIQPQLGAVVIKSIASSLGVSEFYAADIRAGRRRPHPRHWQALADLAGFTPNT